MLGASQRVTPNSSISWPIISPTSRNAREQIKRQNKELAAFRAHYFIDGRFAGDTLKGRANKLAAMDRLGYLPGTVADLRILSNELGKMADLIEGEV